MHFEISVECATILKSSNANEIYLIRDKREETQKQIFSFSSFFAFTCGGPAFLILQI